MINYNETVSVLIIELCNYNNKVERELTIHVHCTPALGLSTGWLLSPSVFTARRVCIARTSCRRKMSVHPSVRLSRAGRRYYV